MKTPVRLVTVLVTTAALAVPASASVAGRADLRTMVQSAAAEYDVPPSLLLAVGFVNTRWEMPSQPSLDGGWGPMHLAEGEPRDSLGLAARLTGADVDELRNDVKANIRGGAAVLAHAAGRPRPSELQEWYPVLADLGGPVYAEQVFQTLRRGAETQVAGRGPLRLAPQDVQPRVQTQSARPAKGGYPRATSRPAHSSNYTEANRPNSTAIDTIVLHVTQGSYAGAVRWFQNPSADVSAHYIVRSSDGAVTQSVPEEDIGWHAGNWEYNKRSIGIEHEGYVDDPSWFSEEMYRSSARLVAYLAEKFGIPIDREHIIGHDEVPDASHSDPGKHWDWDTYLSYVREYADDGTYGAVDTGDDGPPLRARSGPGTSYDRVGSLPDGAKVEIVCQARGDKVRSKAFGYTTDLWDKIGPGRYVSDGYVYTGSRDRVAARC